jgi:hypothetical protein
MGYNVQVIGFLCNCHKCLSPLLQQNYLPAILLNSVTMKKKTRSILEEINAMSPKRDKKQIVESNAQQVIVTAINLINLINESFDEETASDLNKRLLNSIRTQDPKKFARGITKANEDKRHTGRGLHET